MSRIQQRKWYKLMTALGEQALLAAIGLLVGLLLVNLFNLQEYNATYQLEGRPVGNNVVAAASGTPMVVLEIENISQDPVYLVLGDTILKCNNTCEVHGYGELWILNLSKQSVNVKITVSQCFVHKAQNIDIPPGAKLLGVLGQR